MILYDIKKDTSDISSYVPTPTRSCTNIYLSTNDLATQKSMTKSYHNNIWGYTLCIAPYVIMIWLSLCDRKFQ